jgi:arylsulfatase A-like enzyme
MTALRNKGFIDSTVIIFTSDHGGSSWSHGSGDPRSRYIPWIISGPGIEKNHDLTSHYYLTVKTYDTFATACQVLGIARANDGDGNVVMPAFANPPTGGVLKDPPSDAASRP